MNRSLINTTLPVILLALIAGPLKLAAQILPSGSLNTTTTPKVTVVSVNTLSDVHFDVTFANVQPGYSIGNQTYLAFCPDYFGPFDNNKASNPYYNLYSTMTGSSLPVNAQGRTSVTWSSISSRCSTSRRGLASGHSKRLIRTPFTRCSPRWRNCRPVR